MKINDKDDAAEAAFAAQVKDMEDRAALAGVIAASATRPHGSPAATDGVAINVRAQTRPGHAGFRRGGRMWPSTVAGSSVLATERLIACLELEPMVHVRRLDGFPADQLETNDGAPFDLPESFSVPLPKDLGGRQVTQRERDLEAEVLELRSAAAKRAEAAGDPTPTDDDHAKGSKKK